MAKRSSRRRTSASQRVMQIMGILIALSMVLVVLAPLAGSGRRTTNPTPIPTEPPPTATPVPMPTSTPEASPTPGAALAPTADAGS